MTDVVELRRYTLRPGQRDVLIDLFDREFVETQEATGMRVLGQFRDLDRPDQFVWVRGFPDMAVRLAALTVFYTGPDWRAHAATANATMVDTDNVLLLRPAGRTGAFRLDPGVRDRPATSLVVVTIHDLPTQVTDDLVAHFDDTVLPELVAAGATPLGLLTTEYAENDFPGLPVRTGVHTLVTVVSYPSEQAHAELTTATATGLPACEQLRLAPTDRSVLR